MNQSWKTEAKVVSLCLWTSSQWDQLCWWFQTGCASYSKDESNHFPACCNLRHLDLVVALISLLIAWGLTRSNRLTKHPSIPAFDAPTPFNPLPIDFSAYPPAPFMWPGFTSSHSREIGNRWMQKQAMCLQVWQKRTLKVEPSCEKRSDCVTGKQI